MIIQFYLGLYLKFSKDFYSYKIGIFERKYKFVFCFEFSYYWVGVNRVIQ